MPHLSIHQYLLQAWNWSSSRGLQVAPVPPWPFPVQHLEPPGSFWQIQADSGSLWQIQAVSGSVKQFQADSGSDLKGKNDKCCRRGCPSPAPLGFKERTSELGRQQRRRAKIQLRLWLQTAMGMRQSRNSSSCGGSDPINPQP